MTSRLSSGVALVFVLLSATASAQTDSATWRRGSTSNLFGGLAADSNDQAPLVGAAFGWEITPRIGVEARGAWLETIGSINGLPSLTESPFCDPETDPPPFRQPTMWRKLSWSRHVCFGSLATVTMLSLRRNTPAITSVLTIFLNSPAISEPRRFQPKTEETLAVSSSSVIE